MKLTNAEKAEIKQQRRHQDDKALKQAKMAEKAELSHSSALHPIRSTRMRAQKYSHETKQNISQIIGPPQYTREQALSHEFRKAQNMGAGKKIGFSILFIILATFILGSIFL